MPETDIDTPAVITPHHKLETAFSDGPTRPAKPLRFVNCAEHPLSLARHQGRIDCAEFAAGAVYRCLFEKMSPSGHDSTLALMASGGSGMPFSPTRIDAIRAVASVEANLAQPWCTIVRKFCGERASAPEAVRASGITDPKKVWENIRLALNKLDSALSKSGVNIGKLGPDLD